MSSQNDPPISPATHSPTAASDSAEPNAQRRSIVAAHLAAANDERRRAEHQESAAVATAVMPGKRTIPRSAPEPVASPIPIRRRYDLTRQQGSAANRPVQQPAPADDAVRTENLTAAVSQSRIEDSLRGSQPEPACTPEPPAAPEPPPVPEVVAPPVQSSMNEEALSAAVASVEETVARLMEAANQLDQQLREKEAESPQQEQAKPEPQPGPVQPAAISLDVSEPNEVYEVVEAEQRPVILLPDFPLSPLEESCEDNDTQPLIEVVEADEEQLSQSAQAAKPPVIERPRPLSRGSESEEEPLSTDAADELVEESVADEAIHGDPEADVAVVEQPEALDSADSQTDEDISQELTELRDEILSLTRLKEGVAAPPRLAIEDEPTKADEASESPATLSMLSAEADEACSNAIDDLVWNLRKNIPQGRPVSLLLTDIDKQGQSSELAELLPRLAREMDEHLMVIDAASGPRSLTAHWSVKAERGLTDVVAWNKQWSSHLCFPVPEIALLPAAAYGLPRRVDAAAMRKLLNEAQAQYRLVVVVAGPSGGVSPQMLAPMVDQIYVGLHLRRTPPRKALEAIAKLQRAEGKVQGCILTGC